MTGVSIMTFNVDKYLGMIYDMMQVEFIEAVKMIRGQYGVSPFLYGNLSSHHSTKSFHQHKQELIKHHKEV